MRRFRRVPIRWLAPAGSCLLFVGVLCAAGFGLHAAEDWHRHGEVGAGFFHLHFHFGDHQHETPDAHHDHESDTREPSESRVLTIAQAVPDPGPTAPSVAAPEAVSETRIDTQIVVAHKQGPPPAANPRAPPV